MFKKQELGGGFKEAETVIGPSVKVKGNFNSKGNVVVEGAIEGGIKTNGNVFAGDQSKITASVEAADICINGELNGNVKAKGFLQIGSTAKIYGDIECELLSVEEGAILNGKCQVLGATKEEKNKSVEKK